MIKSFWTLGGGEKLGKSCRLSLNFIIFLLLSLHSALLWNLPSLLRAISFSCSLNPSFRFLLILLLVHATLILLHTFIAITLPWFFTSFPPSRGGHQMARLRSSLPSENSSLLPFLLLISLLLQRLLVTILFCCSGLFALLLYPPSLNGIFVASSRTPDGPSALQPSLWEFLSSSFSSPHTTSGSVSIARSALPPLLIITLFSCFTCLASSSFPPPNTMDSSPLFVEDARWPVCVYLSPPLFLLPHQSTHDRPLRDLGLPCLVA